MSSYDVVVVGGGPAGLAAALWAARYRRAVLVVDSGEYRAAAVERSHGYLGRDPQAPLALLETGRRELAAYPDAGYRPGRVVDIAGRADDFRLTLDGGEEVRAHRVVLATGVRDVLPDVRGIEEHYGATAFHCPACDGYEVRDRDVVALGWDERLVGFALSLYDWARSVTLVTEGRRFEGDDQCRSLLAEHGVEVVEERALELCGRRGALTGVRVGGDRVLPASLVFFSIAHRPRDALVTALGLQVSAEGCVAVDSGNQTSLAGVYAAGDLTPGLQLVQVAAAKGTVAGIAAAQSLHGEPGVPRSAAPAPA